MQNTAYYLRISDWSTDVCSSDLRNQRLLLGEAAEVLEVAVLAVDVLDVAVADGNGGGGQDCDAVGFHLRHQGLAATAVFRFRDMNHGQTGFPLKINARMAWRPLHRFSWSR